MPRYQRVYHGAALSPGLQGSVSLYRDTATTPPRLVIIKRARRGGKIRLERVRGQVGALTLPRPP